MTNHNSTAFKSRSREGGDEMAQSGKPSGSPADKHALSTANKITDADGHQTMKNAAGQKGIGP